MKIFEKKTILGCRRDVRAAEARKGFTLVEILAASAIMSLIVVAVLYVTSAIINTWNRSSGQIQTYFDAGVVGRIMQDDLESLLIKKDGGAWLQVAYPVNAGMLTGSNELDTTPLRPPEIMFYAPTSLRPRYTRENLSSSVLDPTNAIPIPGNVCAIKYQLCVKSPFMEGQSDESANASQYNAFYGLYRAVIDPKSTVLEAMGPEKQGTYENEDYRYALQMNLWGQRCTVIDENGVEQPMQDLRSWTLDPENLLAMNIVDFRVRFAISYDNPSYTPGANIPKKKIAFVPPGVGFAVGKKIMVEAPLYSYAVGGGRESVVPTEVENGTLAYADISMTFMSDAGAREMRALMKGQNLSLDKFKELVLAHGNTVTRRVIFMSEPIE